MDQTQVRFPFPVERSSGIHMSSSLYDNEFHPVLPFSSYCYRLFHLRRKNGGEESTKRKPSSKFGRNSRLDKEIVFDVIMTTIDMDC